jgi:hypothetical protein
MWNISHSPVAARDRVAAWKRNTPQRTRTLGEVATVAQKEGLTFWSEGDTGRSQPCDGLAIVGVANFLPNNRARTGCWGRIAERWRQRFRENCSPTGASPIVPLKAASIKRRTVSNVASVLRAQSSTMAAIRVPLWGIQETRLWYKDGTRAPPGKGEVDGKCVSDGWHPTSGRGRPPCHVGAVSRA